MGCFLACFGSSKQEKRRKNAHYALPRNPNVGNQYKPAVCLPVVAEKQDSPEKPITLVAESRVELKEEALSLSGRGNSEEQLSSSTRKKVTFNSNVREYEPIPVEEVPESLHDSVKGGDKAEASENCTKSGKSSVESESGSTLSSLGSYPPNHRYQNCRDSDDEDEELDCELSDLDEDEDVSDDEYYDDDYHPRDVQMLSTGFCSSMESEAKSLATPVVSDGHRDSTLKDLSAEMETKTCGFNRVARDRGGYVHSVLNPVENTTQWKVVKAKGTPLRRQQKENLEMGPSVKQCKSKSDETKNTHEVAVDASLSTWLVSSQKTPPTKTTPTGLEPISSGASVSSHGSNSVRSHEERPILGALTVEELRQFSASSSPRRSPSRSSDGKPLVGTVGVHWNDRTPIEDSGSASSFKGIPNTTSKYREDKRVQWHSTPFETRLERALNRGAAEACSSPSVRS